MNEDQKFSFIENAAYKLGIKLDSGQIEIAREFDNLSNVITKNKTIFNFFSESKKIKGIYLFGGVGRGKSMLMDIFFQNLDHKKKRRLHFHDFMREMHRQIFLIGKNKKNKDPIEIAVENFMKKVSILCFDEMEVKDIADAMILYRLFKNLFSKGLILVSTSNQKPENLYKNGLHRERFLPFIKLINDYTYVYQMDEGKDWREVFLNGRNTWLYPNDEKNKKILDSFFSELTKGFVPLKEKLIVSGREIMVPSSAGGIARFDFKDLCEAPLAVGDYIEIADKYKGLIIYNIPILDKQKNNEARRFIWLIDALYDRKCFLMCTSQTEIKKIYDGNEWKFEFNRTISRLIEMSRIKNNVN